MTNAAFWADIRDLVDLLATVAVIAAVIWLIEKMGRR